MSPGLDLFYKTCYTNENITARLISEPYLIRNKKRGVTLSHIRLTDSTHILSGVGADMRYNKSSHEFPVHDHEFHEIVYIVKGNANHYINGKVFPMTTGCLYFIRNTDIHTYSDFIGDSFIYYTLLFEKAAVHEMFSYYGMEKAEAELLSLPLPPEVQLGITAREHMEARFSELFLMMHNNTQTFKTHSRLLLTELVSEYFTESPKSNTHIPLWLEYACEKMQLPKNLIMGTERFFDICGRKREHCTRTMKKHMGITPNEYIQRLRMKYAAVLLSSGDFTVSEVADECGYNSLPHFYELFTKEFGISPGKYKKQNSKPM